MSSRNSSYISNIALSLSLTGPNNRLKNLHVAGAAAKIAGHPFANIRLGWFRISLEQIYGRHNHTRRADAALRAAAFDECLLHRVKLILGGDRFDGLNRSTFNLCD